MDVEVEVLVHHDVKAAQAGFLGEVGVSPEAWRHEADRHFLHEESAEENIEKKTNYDTLSINI